MNKYIYFSYHTEDESFVTYCKQLFEANGITTSLAQYAGNNSDWKTQVEQCGCFVICLSGCYQENMIGSVYFNELAHAVSIGKQIIVLKIEDMEIGALLASMSEQFQIFDYKLSNPIMPIVVAIKEILGDKAYTYNFQMKLDFSNRSYCRLYFQSPDSKTKEDVVYAKFTDAMFDEFAKCIKGILVAMNDGMSEEDIQVKRETDKQIVQCSPMSPRIIHETKYCLSFSVSYLNGTVSENYDSWYILITESFKINLSKNGYGIYYKRPQDINPNFEEHGFNVERIKKAAKPLVNFCLNGKGYAKMDKGFAPAFNGDGSGAYELKYIVLDTPEENEVTIGGVENILPKNKSVNFEPAKNDEKYVFISYSSKDSTIVYKVKQILESSGIKCWMAPDSIQVGQDYTEVLVDAINNSSGIVFCVTQNSQTSKWVPKELDTAIKADKIIYPIHLDESLILSKINFRITDSQIIEAHGNFDECLSNLIRAINNVKK